MDTIQYLKGHDITPPTARFGRPASWVVSSSGIWQVLLGWQERATQRHALRQMDDHLLSDIGLSRLEVEREASKPFWRK